MRDSSAPMMDAPRNSVNASPAIPYAASGPAHVASLVVPTAIAALVCNSSVARTVGESLSFSASTSSV